MRIPLSIGAIAGPGITLMAGRSVARGGLTMPEKLQVGIVGASGYGGVQLVRLLLDHPGVEIAFLGAHQNAGTPFGELYPQLAHRIDQVCEAIDIEQIAGRCEVVFLATPNGVAYTLAPPLLERGCRVFDLSADYRFVNLATYQTWYGGERQDTAVAREAVYGLPELYRERLRTARLVGCPGCYPTASLLAAAPLLKQGLIDPRSLIIDAKSGVSGAGRTLKTSSLFAEADSSVAAYNVARHRHIPEIEQICSELAGTEVQVQFTPHLIPMARGMLVTLYAQLRDPGLVSEDMLTIYAAFYRQSPAVQILASGVYPQTKWASGTNTCFIGLEVDPRTERVVVLSAVDNLVKGQSGQAIQAMNLNQGWEEMLGLPAVGFYP
ncbi:N-acetyl-gamma-glutamyl-phosphate reductase [Gloeobacter kilaueensis JS1]|uniref:N-acetyl-gamma-glutamyl-phosphate reductase n=2 Tax=Gloeobacter TaxID=33071 RepID=U5QN01_GLOK1|nr:N-acetyl-gamma-glutamyl-phosphate reductase [Gloeobacter kilaueensis]AGY58974.1 N-acetyl-gamma-glutamyl-phosphate reductase [Gloeobacter kilaueensis JS1]